MAGYERSRRQWARKRARDSAGNVQHTVSAGSAADAAQCAAAAALLVRALRVSWSLAAQDGRSYCGRWRRYICSTVRNCKSCPFGRTLRVSMDDQAVSSTRWHYSCGWRFCAPHCAKATARNRKRERCRTLCGCLPSAKGLKPNEAVGSTAASSVAPERGHGRPAGLELVLGGGRVGFERRPGGLRRAVVRV